VDRDFIEAGMRGDDARVRVDREARAHDRPLREERALGRERLDPVVGHVDVPGGADRDRMRPVELAGGPSLRAPLEQERGRGKGGGGEKQCEQGRRRIAGVSQRRGRGARRLRVKILREIGYLLVP
jgi:hypothetical protein